MNLHESRKQSYWWFTYLVSLEDDEYAIAMAKTLKEDRELLKSGFEYVTERDGVKI